MGKPAGAGQIHAHGQEGWTGMRHRFLRWSRVHLQLDCMGLRSTVSMDRNPLGFGPHGGMFIGGIQGNAACAPSLARGDCSLDFGQVGWLAVYGDKQEAEAVSAPQLQPELASDVRELNLQRLAGITERQVGRIEPPVAARELH